MKIKTITCHDVYNLGASLQAYALAAYLKACGHDVQIIDYKPEYLSRHYSLTAVPNPRYHRPVIRQMYLLAKLPGRLIARRSLRKQRFDAFRQTYLPVTEGRYHSAEELRQNCPEADVFIAGSDQIWNPEFPNGRDPAFFLDFVPAGSKRVSYAASFAVESLPQDVRALVKPWLSGLDAVSVRESSAVTILEDLGIRGRQVTDPVFLLPKEHWEGMAHRPVEKDYILVYDFDANPTIAAMAKKLADETGRRIISFFPMDGADAVWQNAGPLEFLGAVLNAGVVISNSFHATAFSLIFEKDFYVLNRKEKINTRMRDLLGSVGLAERLISHADELTDSAICWQNVGEALSKQIEGSKEFLQTNT